MKEKKVKVDVKFLIDTLGNVFAYFPHENYYSKDNIGYGSVTAKNWQDMKTCYAHVGQHSVCNKDYARKCKEAIYSEYIYLLKELHSIGYICNILNPLDIVCHRKPTESEIKFGEGAIHYRIFNINEVGFNKKCEIKSRFKAKDDNLIYSFG